MKKILFILLTFFTLGLRGQELTVVTTDENDCSKYCTWEKGDIHIGVNSSLTNQSLQYLSISPVIGYAITDKDLVYGSIMYADSPEVQFYSLGYARSLCSVAYAGISGGLSGHTGNWLKHASLDLGLYKELNDWLFISPKISLERYWEAVDRTSVTTNITFGIKL